MNMIPFSGEIGVIKSYKWIQCAIKIASYLDMDTEHRELLYEMVTGATLCWW